MDLLNLYEKHIGRSGMYFEEFEAAVNEFDTVTFEDMRQYFDRYLRDRGAMNQETHNAFMAYKEEKIRDV